MSTTSLELVLTNSGLDNDGQLQIREAMHPFWLQAKDWQTKVAEVTDPKIARASRLTLKKIRVEAGHKKDELKEHILVRGRAIDAAFRAIESTIIPLEEQLDVIEKAEQRRLEAEARARADARTRELADLDFRAVGVDLGKLSDEDYSVLLAQASTAKAQRIETERLRAEAEARVAAERKLREEAEAKARAETEAKLAAERKLREEAEAKLRAESEARLAAERKLREEAEAKARAEAAEKAKVEEALRAEERRRAEEAVRKAKEAADEAARAARLASMPDIERLIGIVNQVAGVMTDELHSFKPTTNRGITYRDNVYSLINRALLESRRVLEAAR
jgi:hypothetical protein